MENYLNKLILLPIVKSKWFLKMVKEYNLIVDFKNLNCYKVKNPIEREDFAKGYLKTVNILCKSVNSSISCGVNLDLM